MFDRTFLTFVTLLHPTFPWQNAMIRMVHLKMKLCTDSLTKTLQKVEVHDHGPMVIPFSEASLSAPISLHQ